MMMMQLTVEFCESSQYEVGVCRFDANGSFVAYSFLTTFLHEGVLKKWNSHGYRTASFGNAEKTHIIALH